MTLLFLTPRRACPWTSIIPLNFCFGFGYLNRTDATRCLPAVFSFALHPHSNTRDGRTGPPAPTHSAPHIRTTDIPTSLVERHAPTIHLRARPRPSPTESRPTPTTVSARVGRDVNVAREPGDTGRRRNVVR